MGQGTAESGASRRRIIKRPRLTALLDDTDSQIVALLAPAGYGKTTLARQWLNEPGRRGVWLRATPSLSDVAALAVKLATTATEITGKSNEQLLQWLRTTRDPSSDVDTLAQVIIDITVGWPRSTWLVLDDYQFVAGSEAAEQLADRFISESGIRALITSRVRPSWATVRRVLYGEIFEIGQNVLSMTPDEAAAVLKGDERRREMPGLIALAGGWPAVIGLAALSGRLPSVSDVVPEALHSFFAEEVFRDLPPFAKGSLPKLSLVPEITSGAARALFGREADPLLSTAVQAGFVTKIEDVYELHPLLRQFLKKKLADVNDFDVFDVGERLGKWYLSQRKWDEAFAVGLDLPSAALLGRALDEALDILLSEGRLSTLHEWISLARKHRVRRDAIDLAATEIAFREGRWAEAETRATEVADRLQDRSRASRLYRLAGQSAHLRDRPDEALRYLDLARRSALSATDVRAALWNKFLVLGELEKMDAAKQTLAEFDQARGDDVEAAVRASQARLHLAARDGAVGGAVEAERGTIELLDDVPDPVVVTGFLQTWTTALCLVGKYEESLEAAERELAIARERRLDFVAPHALAALALAFLGLRQFKKATRTARDGGQLAELGQDLHCEMNFAVIRARIELAQGRPACALDELEDRWERKPSPGMHGDFLAIRALALACGGNTTESIRYVRMSEAVSNHVDSRVTRAFARAICATRISQKEARRSLLAAVATTSTAGTVDGFVCAYRAHPPLLRELSEIRSTDAERLLKVAQGIDPVLTRRLGLVAPRSPSFSQGSLSPREREVLDLVRQGLSNKEIGRTLWITEATAKLHVRHILEKLGVRSRTEAALFPVDDL